MYGEYEGLEKIAEIHLEEPDYSFYLLGVWKDENGGYYLATDSGCSCPTPWESHSKEDLTGPLTASQAVTEATSLWRLAGSYDPQGFQEETSAL